MKKFLNKSRKSIVLIMRIVIHVLLALVLFLLLAKNNPQVLRLSRTAAVMLVSYTVSTYMLGRIYGHFDIGVRKSKPIILSMVLSTLMTDVITLAILVIMNTNETTNNEVYPFFGQDILWTLMAYVIQIAIIFAVTYAFQALYFWFVPPEKCLIITDGDENLEHLKKGINKYKKQYSIEGIAGPYDEDIKEKILQYDSIFFNQLPYKESSELLVYCYSKNKTVYRTMDIPSLVTSTSDTQLLGDESILISSVREKNMHQRIIKRLADIIISIIGLIITSPIMLICAIAIKIEDGGKVIFSQNRVTINGRFFKLYKLRTMKENASGAMVKDDDDRITRAGRIIRKFRVDEIPQFVNVLKGEMSVVGPRAEMADRVYINVQEYPEYFYRYRMKAGITGYAQIHGKYNTSAKDKLMLDLTYIQSFSLWNDLKILFQTFFVLLRPDDSTESYNDDDEKLQQEHTKEVSENARKGM